MRPDDLAADDRQRRAGQGARPRPARDRRPAPRLRPAGRRAGLQHGPRRRRRRSGYDDAAGRDHHRLLLVARCRPLGWRSTRSGRARATSSSRPAWRRVSRLRPGQLRLAGRTPTTRYSPRPEGGSVRGRQWRRRMARPSARTAFPNIYMPMGQTAENLAQLKGITREDMDHFGVRSQNLAEKAIANGFWAREITPVTTPSGNRGLRRRRPAAGRDASRPCPRSSRCSARTGGSRPATAARSTTAPPRWSS